MRLPCLRGRLLNWVGREMPPDADRERASLWMYLLGDEANDALRRGEFATAEADHQAFWTTSFPWVTRLLIR